nr:MAG TPA: hypothetical protein [Caudoviricetes sp.]
MSIWVLACPGSISSHRPVSCSFPGRAGAGENSDRSI